MIRAARSEMVRLRRMWALPALAVGLSVLAAILAFSGGGSGPGRDGAAADGALAEPDGILAGLGTAGTLAGLLTLVLWALSVARDLQTGVIRVLLVNEPRRVVYLGGKLAALAATTVVTAVLVLAASVGAAYAAASASGVDTAAWDTGLAWSALPDVALGTLAWGAIGGVVAALARSSAAAIAGGIGYMLLGENLLASVWDGAADWLPGGTTSSLLAGDGDPQTLALVAAYAAVAVIVAVVFTARRDITD